jgi:hypothetical protein
MTDNERADATNGIWLCRNCARIIDRDAERYTVNLLEAWKQTHEAWVLLRKQRGPQVANDIKETFNRLKLLPNQLTERYPYGWVLFNQSRGGPSFPFVGTELRCDAEWQHTQLKVDSTDKRYSLVLPKLTWERSPMTLNITEVFRRPYEGEYELHKPTVIQTHLWAEGEPQIHLEILDDYERAPVYVIGFTKSNRPPPIE